MRHRAGDFEVPEAQDLALMKVAPDEVHDLEAIEKTYRITSSYTPAG